MGQNSRRKKHQRKLRSEGMPENVAKKVAKRMIEDELKKRREPTRAR